MESNFDGLPYTRWFTTRSQSRFEPPCTHGSNRFFIQTQAKTFYNLNVCRASVGCNDCDQRDDTLVLSLHGLIRKFRSGTVEALRIPVAASTRVEYAATCAAALARSDATAAAASNSAAAS